MTTKTVPWPPHGYIHSCACAWTHTHICTYMHTTNYIELLKVLKEVIHTNLSYSGPSW